MHFVVLALLVTPLLSMSRGLAQSAQVPAAPANLVSSVDPLAASGPGQAQPLSSLEPTARPDFADERVWVKVRQPVSLEELSLQLNIDETRLARLNEVDEDHQFRRGEWVVFRGVGIQRLRLVASLDSTTLRWGPPLGEAHAKDHSPANGVLDQPQISDGDQLRAQTDSTTQPSAPPEAAPAGLVSRPPLPPADGPGRGNDISIDRSIDALVRDGTIAPMQFRFRDSIEIAPALRQEACNSAALSQTECQTGIGFRSSGLAHGNLNPSRSDKRPRSRGPSNNREIPTTAVSLRRKARGDANGLGNSNAASAERIPKDSLRRRLDAYRDVERQRIIDQENARKEAKIREAALQAERARLEALKWRTYGQRKVKWDEWKLDEVGNRITRYEIIASTNEESSGQSSSSRLSDLAGSTQEAEPKVMRSHGYIGRIAVSCETLKLITTPPGGAWGVWGLPEKGTPDEALVLDLCSNIAIRERQKKKY